MTTTPVMAAGSSRVGSVLGTFLDPPYHIKKVEGYAKSADGVDKFLKALEPLVEAMKVISERWHASADVVEGFSDAHYAVKNACNVTAVLNIFGGVLRSIAIGALRVILLVKDIFTSICTGKPTETLLNPRKEESLKGQVINLKFKMTDENSKEIKTVTNPTEIEVEFKNEKGHLKTFKIPKDFAPHHAEKYNDRARGLRQQLLALGAQVGFMGAGGGYAAGFGVCKIAGTLDSNGAPLGPTGKKVAAAFADCMMFNHICAIVGNTCELGFQYYAMKDALDNDLFRGQEAIIRAEFERKARGIGVSLTVKSLELCYDVVKKVAPSVPPEIRLPLAILIGVGSMIEVYHKQTVPS